MTTRARGIRFVQDALREVPGATVVQAGSYWRSQLAVSARRGERLREGPGGWGPGRINPGGAYNWANLTTENVDRIEILRGPGSVIYGSDAVSGVVQIFTRRGQGGVRRSKAGRRGAPSARSIGHVGVLGGPTASGYSADAGRFTTDGTYAFNNDYGNTVPQRLGAALPDARTDASLVARYSR